ncbi:MAG TPA: amidohydrolase family protein [Pseudolabrys sp.]|nr:amidohydrolase family protein [Pseudolabrys sp.]
MITDVHVHHVPEAFVRFIERAAPYAIRREASRGEIVGLRVGQLEFALTRTFFDPERLLARMTQMRVDRAVLSLATPFVSFDVPASLGVEAAELYNNEIASLRKAMPHHFGAWAYLPMQEPDAAANELRRAVTSLGASGGYLPSNVKGRYLDAEELTPVFATASELDVPLMVHPSNPPARERMAKHELAVVAGYLFDTTLNIFNMVFGGLFDRFPNLKVYCTHLGGYALLLQARMQRELDTNPALAARLQRPLQDYLRLIYFDTICFDPAYARAAVESGAVIPSHLLLGSDTPFPLGEPDPVGFVERSFGSQMPSLAEQILHRNAGELLAPRKSGAGR